MIIILLLFPSAKSYFCVEGLRPEGNDEFTVYAGGGDRVVEAFRIKVML